MAAISEKIRYSLYYRIRDKASFCAMMEDLHSTFSIQNSIRCFLNRRRTIRGGSDTSDSCGKGNNWATVTDWSKAQLPRQVRRGAQGMRTAKLAAIVLALMLCPLAQGQHVKVNWNAKTNFSKYKTYSWKEAKNPEIRFLRNGCNLMWTRSSRWPGFSFCIRGRVRTFM